MAYFRTGGETDAWCTKCRMVLAHTILALEGGRPARVECNTCRGQHNYRSGTPDGHTSTPRARSAGESPSRTRLSFDDVIAQKRGPPKTYSPKGTFAVDDTISHPTFGYGFVSAVRNDKIDVTFRVGVKTFIHARG